MSTVVCVHFLIQLLNVCIYLPARLFMVGLSGALGEWRIPVCSMRLSNSSDMNCAPLSVAMWSGRLYAAVVLVS